MKKIHPRTLVLLAAAFLAATTELFGEPTVIPVVHAIHQPGLECKLRGNGRDLLTVSVSNQGAVVAQVDVPSGLICKSPVGERIIVLRGTQVNVPPGSASEAQIPTAALSTKNALTDTGFEAGQDAEPKLAPLLKFLATRNDVPRSTSQLVAFALLEDVNFAQWQEFLARAQSGEASGQPRPTPAEVTQAIDALGILHEVAPEKTFALGTDSGLKLRALRNPWSRAKAMQLYGMTIPGDAPPGAVPPDLGQLLHTKPGDNCPICRMRAQMQGAPSDL